MVEWEKSTMYVVGCVSRIILSLPRHSIKVQILFGIGNQVAMRNLTSFRKPGCATAKVQNSWPRKHISRVEQEAADDVTYLSARTLGSDIFSQEYVA
jgi:hypothetical protein